MFYFTFNLHTTDRKFHKTSVCVQACHLMTPVGFVRNMETVVKGRMPAWEKPAIRRAMESSGPCKVRVRVVVCPSLLSLCGLVHRICDTLGMTSSSLPGTSQLPRLIVPSSSVFRKHTLSSLGDCAIFEGKHRVKPSQHRQHLVHTWHRASTDFIVTSWTRRQFSSQSDTCVGLTT